jgi:hypothetical protein
MRTLTILFLASCVGSQFKPATIATPPDAFTKASRTLIDRGDTLETKDEAAGVLITKWEDTEVLGLKRRYRWKVSTAGATLTVDSQCQEFEKAAFTGEGKWNACVNQSDDRGAAAQSIADAIAGK